MTGAISQSINLCRSDAGTMFLVRAVRRFATNVFDRVLRCQSDEATIATARPIQVNEMI